MTNKDQNKNEWPPHKNEWEQLLDEIDAAPQHSYFGTLSDAEIRRVWSIIEEQLLAHYPHFVRVWPEWFSSGIWLVPFPGSRYAGKCFDLEDLGISIELQERIQRWQDDFNSHSLWTPEKFHWESFHAEEEKLTQALKRELGERVYVERRGLREMLLDGTTRDWRSLLGLAMAPESLRDHENPGSDREGYYTPAPTPGPLPFVDKIPRERREKNRERASASTLWNARSRASFVDAPNDSWEPPKMRKLLNAMQKSTKSLEAAKQAGEPQVGIFWDLGGTLILFRACIDGAETWGKFKNYPECHETMWCRYQELGGETGDREYDAPPRGRVLYDTISDQFLLYADRCILRNESMMHEICTELLLPSNTKIGLDDHYRCEACLRQNPIED